ncbi:MAG: TonB-dependent receptor, partial [Bdellovibrionales bacterium]|nr:TonB-dependent receptor [Bdellovibrionales bacterium]
MVRVLASVVTVFGMFFVFGSAQASASSEPAAAEDALESESEMGAIQVLGASKSDLTQPTAPTRVSKKKIEKLQTSNVNEALKSAPGVYVREEDAEGLRPNIGLRGTNPDRSKKIVILRDGILAGPAPYSAPAAYYVPSMSHTESLEVMSGFTAVHYGPNSIGGAINYVTPQIPVDGWSQFVDLGYGSFNTRRLQAEVSGGKSNDDGPKFGYLVRVSQVASDGFKKLDTGGETGFTQNDVFAKFKLGSNFGATFGFSNETSDETYLGLSAADFNSSPYRRYAASEKDEMKWEHWFAQLEYEKAFSDGFAQGDVLNVAAYHQRFRRDWYRLDKFRGATAKPLREILNKPDANQLFYDILRGDEDTSTVGTDGELVVFSNDRTYVSQGVQARWVGEGKTGDLKHSYQSIVRVHHDRIDRDHTYDYYEMNQGRMVRTATPTQQDRLNMEEALATLVSAQDDISYGSWVFTLVGRAEVVDFKSEDKVTGVQHSRSDTVFVPGAGLLRKFGDSFSARASVNRAVTVAGLDASGKDKREEAVNYEWGFRYFGGDQDLQADLTFFFNDYENLTGTCTASVGCATPSLDTQLNGGQASIYGVEARVAEGFMLGRVWVPLEFNVTLLSATLESDWTSTNAEWGSGPIRKGDPLPYVPQ